MQNQRSRRGRLATPRRLRLRPVMAASVCALAVAGCSSGDPGAPVGSASSSVPADVVTSPTVGYRVGATSRLTTDRKVPVAVRLVRTRSVVGSNEATPAGRRLFAAQFTVTNRGTVRTTVTWGSDLADDTHPDGGPTRPTAVVTRIDAGALLREPLTLAPGESATGWVTYYLSTARKAVAIDFGVADDTAGITHWAMTAAR